MTIPFCSVVWKVSDDVPGGDQVGEDRHFRRAAPEASGPDRVVGIALLELDPDARAEGGNREHSRLQAAHRARRACTTTWAAARRQSGTMARIRPICIGSTLSSTTPRYLP